MSCSAPDNRRRLAVRFLLACEADWKIPGSSFVVAHDEELQRIELRSVGSIQNVADILQRDRFPLVHPQHNIATTHAGVGCRAFAANTGNEQSASISAVRLTNLPRGDRFQPQSD